MVGTIQDVITGLHTYVVAPLNAFGLGGFLFDTPGESIANLSTEITDHYTEDNVAVQDHIAIKPKKITLKGYIGEVVYDTAGSNVTATQNLTQKLTEIDGFVPVLTAAAIQAQNAISGIESAGATLASLAEAVPAAANVYGLVKNILGATGDMARQQNAYNYFQALMNGKILLGVQTPWEFMTNMAIETIIAVQEENSIFISDFIITLKQIRVVETSITAYVGAALLEGAAALQGQNLVNIGNVPGVALPSGLLPGAQGIMTGVSDLDPGNTLGNLFQFTP